MEGLKYGRKEGWKDGRMEGRKDGRMKGWKDGRMEGYTLTQCYKEIHPSVVGSLNSEAMWLQCKSRICMRYSVKFAYWT